MNDKQRIAKLEKEISELKDRLVSKDKEITILRRECRKQRSQKTKARGRSKKVEEHYEQLIETAEELKEETAEVHREILADVKKHKEEAKQAEQTEQTVILDASGKERRFNLNVNDKEKAFDWKIKR